MLKEEKNIGLIDTEMIIQLRDEKNYWIQVLRRITDVIK